MHDRSSEHISLMSHVAMYWAKSTPGACDIDREQAEHHRIGFCDGSLPGILSQSQISALMSLGILDEQGGSVFADSTVVPFVSEDGDTITGFFGSNKVTVGAGIFNLHAWKTGDIVLFPEPFEALSSGKMTATCVVGLDVEDLRKKYRIEIPPELSPESTFTDTTAIFTFTSANYRVKGIDKIRANSMRVLVDAVMGDLRHTDRVELYASRARASFSRGVERVLEVPAPVVESDLAKIISSLEAWMEAQQEGDDGPPPLTDEEREAAIQFLQAPDLLDRIGKDISALGYVGEDANKKLLYLIATSRKLDSPMASLIKGPSASGKSALMELVADLMPPEDVFYFSRISPQALYYMHRDSLVHKLLVIDERDGSAEADYSIRTLLTRRRLSMAVVLKDGTGPSRTKIFEILGPISYMESTTSDSVNPENENRCFVLFTDDGAGQTGRIHEAQKGRYREGAHATPEEIEAIRKRHRDAQRLLEPLPVMIPFVDQITFPADQVRARRDHNRFLSLVSTVTFLHQYQRERTTDATGRTWVVATPEDYRIGYDLAMQGLAGGLAELAPPVAAAFDRLQAGVDATAKKNGIALKDMEWSRGDAVTWTGMPMSSVRRLLSKLVDCELIEPVAGRQGSRCRYRLTDRKPFSGNLEGITRPEELA